METHSGSRMSAKTKKKKKKETRPGKSRTELRFVTEWNPTDYLSRRGNNHTAPVSAWTHGSRPTDSCSKRTQQSSAGARTEDTRGDGTAPRRVFGEELRNTPACPSGGQTAEHAVFIEPTSRYVISFKRCFHQGGRTRDNTPTWWSTGSITQMSSEDKHEV